MLRAELAGAFMLLTRLPVGWLARREMATPVRCVWAYPLVGLVVGGIGAAVYAGGVRAGLTPGLAAAWSLAALVLVTGALHEDGLADTADGFGGGRSRARKLEIMRDSRIGTFGALALVLSLGMRGMAMAALAQPGRVAAGLVVAAALGRGGMAAVLLLLSPARPDGLAAALAGPGRGRVALGPVLAVVAAVIVLPAGLAGLAVAASAVVTLGMVALARRHVGGHTGDVLGACEAATECAVLSALAASW